jgi:hypothetical protein
VADPELTHRAEQAYLGALIAAQGKAVTVRSHYGDGRPAWFAHLRPQDFADPVHQAVYAALASTALPERGGLAGAYDRLRAQLTRLLSPRARSAAVYMALLPALCPDPANMPAYAAMVAEASQARTVPAPAAFAPVPPAAAPPPAGESPRLASAGQWLDTSRSGRHLPGPRQAEPPYTVPPPRAGRPPDGLDRGTARLTRVLSADARHLTDRAAPSATPAPVPPGNQPAPLSATALLTANVLQEQVLADLMLNPAGRGDIASWLPARVFDAGPNRTLYQLINLRLAGGRPVDPLIIAWDASALVGGGITGQGESPAAAALHLGTLNPAPGAAAVFAQLLYAEQVCRNTFGPNWQKQPTSARVPAVPTSPARAPAVPASPAPASGPAPARQAPATGPQPRPVPKAASRAAQPTAAASTRTPARPPLASGLPTRHPPLPDPAGPAPQP